jgi:hypothetical protein
MNKAYAVRKALYSLILLTLGLALCMRVAAGEDRSLEDERLLIAATLRSFLKSELGCTPGSRCDPTHNLFVSPSRLGLAISVFGVDSHLAAAKIGNLAIELAVQLPKSSRLDLKVFVATKAEDLARSVLRHQDVFVEISSQGGKNAKR